MKWLALLGLLPVGLLIGGLWLNAPPVRDPPGPIARLKTYLTTNVAETVPDHAFAELRTPLVRADLPATRAAVHSVMQRLGWEDIQEAGDEIQGTVVTRWLHFRDEVRVRLEATPEATRVHARSASRVGRGDLGANAAHLRTLFAAINDQVAAKPR
jgi:uncharacterized protein (DUF1499 family)